ncbi:MAG: Transposase [Parcubacteria group bacterium GW2011_GWA2_42_18]|nr:MAG: Transposase [Parcubacteria group bacterium GW2011_GWA2_42_18]
MFLVFELYILYNLIMSNRKIPFIDGEYYHIYSRGNSKQKIFLSKEDYDYFIKCLYCRNTYKSFRFRDDIVKWGINAFDFDRGEIIVSIGAWVLMPNHFHIYITTNHKSDLWKEEKKSRISEFMRKVLTAYVKYFNAKYKRTGGLFEGKFKSTHIKKDNQAKYLFSYIHLNPIKLIDSKWKEQGIKNVKKALDFLNNYKWSSYHDYINPGHRKESKILDIKNFPKYFDKIKDFNREIISWLRYKDQI